MEANSKVYRWKSTNYQLSLEPPDDKDDIDQIFQVLSDIMLILKDKNYKIINYEEIFEDLVNLFSNKELKDLCKLHNVLNLFKYEKINHRLIENFYNQIHQKGLFLIKSKNLNSEEIIQFLVAQDIYYYSQTFKNSDNRDSEIFKYISITDEDKN